jgi:hypothetical protein
MVDLKDQGFSGKPVEDHGGVEPGEDEIKNGQVRVPCPVFLFGVQDMVALDRGILNILLGFYLG